VGVAVRDRRRYPRVQAMRTGHPRPQVQYVTQFLLGDPGGGDLLAVPVAVQGVDDLVELGG